MFVAIWAFIERCTGRAEFSSPSVVARLSGAFSKFLGLLAYRLRRTVQWFDDSKGYGFSQQQEGEQILVHVSASETQGFCILAEDEEVEYELCDSEDGPHASNVIRA